ncbi:Uma2 family endonuclease [Nostoc sp.]|uniref:Uma2 family endonuclease n=1 Tax=Nostoc sp. TaxID=1180 RepID=UPI002FFBF608
MDNTKKEHYISQFYLKKFANLSPNGKNYKICIFNKITQNSPYSSDVKDTATENYFYDFPVYLVGEDNKKIFDTNLQKIESIIAPFYKKAVELRSASDSLKTVQQKMQEYIDNGVRLGWLIDPQNQQVEIYRPGQEVEVLRRRSPSETSPTSLSGEDILPGFVLDLAQILS